jgi:bifunctional non-homologous end joining protein LigD
MKPMLPSLSFDIPQGKDWFYEVKYDGFRAILDWGDTITLTSRNGNSLLEAFPEIQQFLLNYEKFFKTLIPFTLDGELVLLENPYKADFGSLQIRGRMRSTQKILEKAKLKPCKFLVFDILMLKGKPLLDQPYLERKHKLGSFFSKIKMPNEPNEKDEHLLQLISFDSNFEHVWEKVVLHDGEGVVAKQGNSKWEEGKRTNTWIKHKNWKYVSCFLTSYDKSNGYFYIGVFKGREIVPIGLFLFGLQSEEKNALTQIIKANKTMEDDKFIYVDPAICVEIKYLELYEDQIREPHFHQFRFDLQATECTFDKFLQQQKNKTLDVDITHPNKPIWATPPLKKIDYIHYLREVSPYMLPFLKDRVLTVIRYPHGLFGEAFYQKNRPDYSPEFVQTHTEEGIDYIVCNELKTLMWLGNQLSIEFHIPFQTIHSKGPSEIVFDLDPPSKDYFSLAVKAALYIKEVLDQLNLICFVKTSGNKGLQIYLPLPEDRYSYDQTRLFTSFIADYLVTKDPESFTIERLKKNRGERLYVDYLQHAEGKTIVAPYSPRGKNGATVATPLYWQEVNERLSIDAFQITNIVERIKTKGCPFQTYFQVKEQQNFQPILDFLKVKNH